MTKRARERFYPNKCFFLILPRFLRENSVQDFANIFLEKSSLPKSKIERNIAKEKFNKKWWKKKPFQGEPQFAKPKNKVLHN